MNTNKDQSVGQTREQELSQGVAAVATGSASVVLHLVLTHHWYDQTESGAKRTEYRTMTERWKRQIWDRRERITAVRFARGYTSRTLTRSVESIDVGPCPIPGWSGDYYRIHFSASPNSKAEPQAQQNT